MDVLLAFAALGLGLILYLLLLQRKLQCGHIPSNMPS